MKHRNDGGYSLALVLVVMAVLATIVTVLLTVTIDNMKVQEKQIERMQDQYEAQGKLEKVLAELSQNQVVQLSSELGTNFPAALKKIVKNACSGTDVEMADGENDYTFEFTNEDLTGVLFEEPFKVDFKLSAESGSVTVVYEMTLEGNISHSAAPEAEASLNNYMYLVTKPVLTHRVVDVSGVLASEGGGG